MLIPYSNSLLARRSRPGTGIVSACAPAKYQDQDQGTACLAVVSRFQICAVQLPGGWRGNGNGIGVGRGIVGRALAARREQEVPERGFELVRQMVRKTPGQPMD